MAIEIAEAVVGALRGELAATAVNAPMVPSEVLLNLNIRISLYKLISWYGHCMMCTVYHT